MYGLPARRLLSFLLLVNVAAGEHDGADHEIEFWKKTIETYGGRNWPRLDPSKPIVSALRRYLQATAKHSNILVVGSGPSSDIGYRSWPGHTVSIYLTDALAEKYEAMYQSLGYYPPATPTKVAAEKLHHRFAHGAFDLVYSVNALDHADNPVKALQSMVAVAAPCAWVVVEVWEDEGKAAGGVGMHQWNIRIVQHKPLFAAQKPVAEIMSVKTGVKTIVTPTLLGASKINATLFNGCYLNGDCNMPDKPRVRIEIQKSC